MRFAIIAAGEGSRLKDEGIAVPKPLVGIGGERLIDRLLRIFVDNGADDIVVICNDRSPLVADRLRSVQRSGLCGRAVPLRFIVGSTPSSMHSLYAMSGMLAGEPFVLTTVDTVFDEREFSRYVAVFRRSADCLMGVTDYVDDEKPLYVGVDDDMTVTGYYDSAPGATRRGRFQSRPFGPYVSAGIYGLQPSALAVLERCIRRGEARMRNFQRALLREGETLRAFAFSHVFDIDHASDITKAERRVALREELPT